jgi:hypothetical protein
MSNTLTRLNTKIEKLTAQRDAEMHKLRSRCQHLRLVEGTTSDCKPHRICVDCGAEEDGWCCGWHILLIDGDTWSHCRPTIGDVRKKLGVLVSKPSTSSDWMKYRKEGLPYFVGQSHVNFEGGGKKTYKELTEQES